MLWVVPFIMSINICCAYICVCIFVFKYKHTHTHKSMYIFCTYVCTHCYTLYIILESSKSWVRFPIPHHCFNASRHISAWSTESCGRRFDSWCCITASRCTDTCLSTESCGRRFSSCGWVTAATWSYCELPVSEDYMYVPVSVCVWVHVCMCMQVCVCALT